MMEDRFKFKIVVFERNYEPKTDWKFAEIMKDNNNWHLTMCGDIASNNCRAAHYRRDNAPDNVCRVYEPIFCTGLKDKNGKLIYESDIVKDKTNHIRVVVWEQDQFKYPALKTSRYFHKPVSNQLEERKNDLKNKLTFQDNIWKKDKKYFEVIGNIYENSDLLSEVE